MKNENKEREAGISPLKKPDQFVRGGQSSAPRCGALLLYILLNYEGWLLRERYLFDIKNDGTFSRCILCNLASCCFSSSPSYICANLSKRLEDNSKAANHRKKRTLIKNAN